MSPRGMCPMKHLTIRTRSAEETQILGRRLGRLGRPGDVICLEGELGSGKTCLAQGIGLGLGHQSRVTSPSFTLINEHRAAGELPLYHIDLYRLEGREEALGIGIQEYLYNDGVCVVEWAERASEIMPAQRLWIKLKHAGENQRALCLQAQGERYEQLMAQLREGM